MSKVKKEIVEAAAIKLMTNITSTMPTTAYKFLLGSATALATMNNGQKIHEMIGLVADPEGFINVEAMKAVIDGGFSASGGKISVDLFKNQTGLLSLLVKPLTLTITKDDIDQLMSEIEANAIQDVQLSAAQEPKPVVAEKPTAQSK